MFDGMQPVAVASEKISSNEFSCISFFSGCGGLDLGFEGGFKYKDTHVKKRPFKVIAAYDNEFRCIQTYRSNISKSAYVCDLSSASVSEFVSANVLLGGFPCQDFSTCGPRKGLKSDRGQLYKTMVRYAELHRPEIIVCENVAGMLWLNEGRDYRTIRRAFVKVGYRCNDWLLNAESFGVPQSRRRVFLVFVRSDLKDDPSIPKMKFASSPRSLSWAIDDLIGVDDERIANQSQYFRAARAERGHGQGDEISSANLPAYTVRANAKSRVQFHYKLDRRLTIRECARIQTFPDWFVFPHPATESIRQIGNAVPPVLANAVAGSIADHLRLNGVSPKSVPLRRS